MEESGFTEQNENTDNLFIHKHGGMLSAPDEHGISSEIYFLGIIDILQLYNTSKRAETFFKGLLGSDT